MLLKSDEIIERLGRPPGDASSLVVAPMLDRKGLEAEGDASVDLRLGCWFTEFRRTHHSHLKLGELDGTAEPSVTRTFYVPFRRSFYLHPQTFILAATLEWIRMPVDVGGYVMGRSSWGRRGLVIATAVGVHPGFTGCLTLEVGNIGELPIEIRPGMKICQLFLHSSQSKSPKKDETRFAAQRRPVLGQIKPDPISEALTNHSL